MKNDSLNRFKEEMNKRGLFRKIKACVNLIPPPPGVDAETLITWHKAAAKEAVIMYAQQHDDFAELLAEASLDHLFETILTDDLFNPEAGFMPTAKEQTDMEGAKATAELLMGLFDFLKTI